MTFFQRLVYLLIPQYYNMSQSRSDLNNDLDALVNQANGVSAAATALNNDVVAAKARVDALPGPGTEDFQVEVDKINTVAGILTSAQATIASAASTAQNIAP